MKSRSNGRPKGKSKKWTNAEVNQFLREAQKKVLDEHLSYTEFIEWSTENNHFGEKQAAQYWKKIWSNIREKFRLEKDKLVDKQLERYWSIHDKAVSKGDLNTARQVLNDIGKLMGLNEPDKLDVNNVGEIKFKFGDEE